EDYRKAILDSYELSIDPDDSIEVKTVINKNNEILAKSYTAIDGSHTACFAYINGSETAAFEISEDYATLVSANITKTDEKNGTINLKVSEDAESSPVSIKIEYKNLERAKFLNNDVVLGTYIVSVTPPADFTSDSSDAEVYAAISSATLTISSELNGSELCEKISVRVPQYGSVGVTIGLGAVGADDLAIPQNPIDLSAAVNSGELSEEDSAKLQEMVDEIFDAVKDSDSPLAGFIADALDDFGEINISNDYPDYDYDTDFDTDYGTDNDFGSDVTDDVVDTDQLYDRIYTALLRLDDLYSGGYDITDEQAAEIDDMYERLYDIYMKLFTEDITENMYAKMCAETDSIEQRINAIFDSVGGANTSNISFELPEYNYSNMSYDELNEAISVVEEHFFTMSIAYFEDILEDEELNTLYTQASDKYSDMCDAYGELTDAIIQGNLSVPKLRDACKAARIFDEAVREFDAALISKHSA
ncbi:MAG: hypothetical protein ACI4Q4_00130, partial [Oscillospiraceae bacterium]